jgi:hypothetical protein
MPSRNQYQNNEEYNAYFREYNAKNREKIREYKRDWMRKYRAEKKKGVDK